MKLLVYCAIIADSKSRTLEVKMPVWLQCIAGIAIPTIGVALFLVLGTLEKEMPEWRENQACGLPCLVFVILYLAALAIGGHAIYRIFAGG